MLTITTKYLGPTNHRGARITASYRPSGGLESSQRRAFTVTVPYDHGASQATAHAIAFRALVEKLGWQDLAPNWRSGENDRGYSFVPELDHNRVSI